MGHRRFSLVVLALVLGIFAVVGWLVIWPHPSTAAAANELRVCNASGGFYSTIQSAVDAAEPGDIIKVAAGVYTEGPKLVGSSPFNLYITKTVHIFGGYTCAEWVTRDYTDNLTSIRPYGPDTSVVYIRGMFDQGSTLTPTLDGFTISGGGGGNHGGGISIVDSDALIRNNTITDNRGYLLGGGVWVQRGAPFLEHNRIENNIVTPSGNAYGGGVDLENTQATLVNNIIAGNILSNTTGSGGGVAVLGGGPVTLLGNTILANTAANQAGGANDYAYGGGVSVEGALVILEDNLIQENTANALKHGFGGGVYILNSPAFTLTSNSVMSNTAGFALGSGPYLIGGGILIETSSGALSANLLAHNRANRNTIFGNGGGLAAITSKLSIQGGEITDNSVSRNCEGYGGGIYLKDSSLSLDAVRINENCAANTPFYGKGGGLAFVNSLYTLTNALIDNNYAFGNDTAVGGIYVGANSPGSMVNNTIADNGGQGIRTASPITLTNNIILGHTTGVSLTAALPVSATFNNFYDNFTNVRGFSLNPTNIVINPQVDSGYRLTSPSPAIDAGTHTNAPISDMDGEPRPMTGSSGLYRVDIGADEFSGDPQENLDVSQANLTLIGPGNPPENPDSNGPNDWIGFAVSGADVNGDGRADLLTAAEDWAEDFDNPPLATGRLFGLFNFNSRITGTIDLYTDTADVIVISRYLLQHVGSAFTSGDLNDDGSSDLIFGSFQDDNAGNGMVTPTVFAYWGGPSLSGTQVLTDATPADFMLRAPGQDFFAYSAKNALVSADLNGDGIDDLIVGDGLADDGNQTDTGAAFVIFGSSTLGGLHELALTAADFSLYGPDQNAGLERLAIGYIDAGDSLDLIARTGTTAYVILGPLSSGSLHLLISQADITITGLQPGGLIILDIDGDGADDVILGSNDKLYVIPGPLQDGQVLDAPSSASLTISGAPAEAFAAGDVAGDEKPDLLLGIPSMRKAFVIAAGIDFSGDLPIEDIAQIVVSGDANALGKDIASGDLDNDGRPDLIVGSFGVNIPSHPPKFEDAGAVYVFYSSYTPPPPPEPTPTPSPTPTQPPPRPGNQVFLPLMNK